jgi:non-canonical poly(A) RNA polymerase PAPD5/7
MLGKIRAKIGFCAGRGKHQSTLFVLRVVITAGLLMQPSHTRLICRAHNRFTPSIALWQHFVAPDYPTTHQQRHSSSATEPVQDGAGTNRTGANGTPLNAQEASGVHNSEAEVETTKDAGAEPKSTNTEPKDKSAAPAWEVRRPTTVKGRWLPKVDSSIQKNLRVQDEARKAAFAESGALLAVARAAFDDAKEYDGVVVKPMQNARPVKESELPWCLRKPERTVSGIDRYNLSPPWPRSHTDNVC